MMYPILHKIQESPPTGPLKDDPIFAGYPWEIIAAGALVKGSQILRNKDPQHLGDRSTHYVKVPESLVQSANVAVTYNGAVLLIAHHQVPDKTSTASYKNPRIFNYYKWIPYAYQLGNEWLSQHEFTRRILPDHREPDTVEVAMTAQERFDKRRELMQTGEFAKVKYVCTCGSRHRWSLYKELGEKPPNYCPNGGLVNRVVYTKYVCTCTDARHVRTIASDSYDTVPEVCPAGSAMTKEGEGRDNAAIS